MLTEQSSLSVWENELLIGEVAASIFSQEEVSGFGFLGRKISRDALRISPVFGLRSPPGRADSSSVWVPMSSFVFLSTSCKKKTSSESANRFPASIVTYPSPGTSTCFTLLREYLFQIFVFVLEAADLLVVFSL